MTKNDDQQNEILNFAQFLKYDRAIKIFKKNENIINHNGTLYSDHTNLPEIFSLQ